MFTEPNTEIYLLNAVPLDTNYINTIIFDSASSQYNYFYQRRSKSLSEYSYQRINRNTIRVGVNYHDLLVCNYLMFKNNSHENKWYYAFITNYNYINEVTSEITYEIDVMQTYMFDYAVNKCLVEREHSATDNLFENTIPENLDCGQLVQAVDFYKVDLSDMWVCILVSKNEDDEYVSGGFINNVYTPIMAYTGYSKSDASSLNAILKKYIENGRESEIIAIYQYPRQFSTAELHTERANFNITNFTTLNGHTVRNKKLFTFPYTYILVDNYCGETATYKLEEWGTTEHVGEFDLWGTFISLPEARLIPRFYRNLNLDKESALSLKDFPECAWIGDAYAVWYAQHKSQISANLLSSVLSNTVSGAESIARAAIPSATEISQTASTLGAITGTARAIVNVGTDVAKVLATESDMKRVPPQIHGQAQSSTFNAGAGDVGFAMYQFSVKKEYLEIIDDYFDRFGYKCHRHKVPNTNVRPHWTYTKTVGCTINGTLPHFAEEKICQIYDNGITFWKNADEVGNYSLDNSPS